MQAAAAPVHALAAWVRHGTNADERMAEVWALREISFDVMPGQLLGLIGRNGAGKSTLLKILSRITEPTLGRIELHGRVGSLLEVGTGFNYELTGRENIFLSGALLGMRRAEIQRHFDEIVSFAGIDNFIDIPVKRYSSGMAVRLGFAVAAHLQAEILLIDEVLAVGDLAFQRKCIGKMNDIARESGRTIVFVSHNMAAVESLCDRCLLLDGGQLILTGTTQEALARYIAGQAVGSTGKRSLVSSPGRYRHCQPVMNAVELYSRDAQPTGVFRMGSAMSLIVTYQHDHPFSPVLGARFKTIYGAPVFTVSDRYCEQLADCVPLSRGRIVCSIDKLPLMPGTYIIDLYLGDAAGDFDVINEAISFEVIEADINGTGRLANASGGGPVFCSATWKLVPERCDGLARSDATHANQL